MNGSPFIRKTSAIKTQKCDFIYFLFIRSAIGDLSVWGIATTYNIVVVVIGFSQCCCCSWVIRMHSENRALGATVARC